MNLRTKAYSAWKDAKARCNNKSNPQYYLYGGRGITMCGRWNNFQNFLLDMGLPRLGLSIERRNNNKGYNKKNCFWATPKQQSRNRRVNQYLRFKGKTFCLSEWAEKQKIARKTLSDRLFKLRWSIKDALTRPIQIQDKKRKQK